MIRHLRKTLPLLIAGLIVSGCSTKEYFDPQSVRGSVETTGSLEGEIVDATVAGAVLENRKVITRSAQRDVVVPEGYRFVSESDGWIISANIDGNVRMQSVDDPENVQTIDLKQSVAGLSRNGDILAVLFASNEMALYSVKSGSLLFKEQGSAPIAVDARIVNPYFLNELVLYLTLEGKIVIVNSETKTVLRSIIVSSEAFFNNIIYFNVIDNVLVAATPARILSFGEREAREAYDIRDVIFNREGIWLSTKQGEVVALTPSLQLKAKVKLPFAHFLGMIYSDGKLYLLEKEGYVIVMEDTLESYEVYEADFDEGYVFVADKTFYVHDAYLDVK